jgi:hypothetical protein
MGVCLTKEQDKSAINVPESDNNIKNMSNSEISPISATEHNNSIILSSNNVNTEVTYNVKYKKNINKGVISEK